MTGVFPTGVEPVAVSFPPAPESSDYLAFINSADGAGQYLIEITAFKGGEVRSGGLATIGEIPTATIPTGGGVNIGEVELLFSDRSWVGDPTDADKPNVYYEGRAEIPLVNERAIPIFPEGDRRVRKQVGFIRLANHDGALDSIVRSYAVDGRQTRVRYGPYFSPYKDYTVIVDALGLSWEGRQNSIEINLRDRSLSLDKPLQTTLYGGTGGADGTTDIEGKPKPLVFGKVLNITPVLIDPTNLIYQVHDGTISDVLSVYDQGDALTDSTTDVASYSALVSESVSAGNFATANAVGMFKLGSSPAGLITCDILGDAPNVAAAPQGYADTLDVIAERVLVNVAGVSVNNIRTDTFAGVAAIAGEMGFYISQNETPTTGEVLDLLFASVGAWWGSDRLGKIRAGRLIDPASKAPAREFDEFSLIEFEQETTFVPRWRQRVGYQRNWTVQRGEDLDAAVTDARRQFLAEPFRAVSSSDSTVKTRHLEAMDPPPLVSLYDNETDAQTLADLLKDLYSPDRRAFRSVIKRRGYSLDLGSVIRVSWPRYGLSNGINLMVIQIREDADKEETSLRLWG